jgi:hypothetical protein
MTTLRIAPLEPSGYQACATLVNGSPDGSPYCLVEYLDALCGLAGGRFQVLVLFRGEELVGGLPLRLQNTRYGVRAGARLLLLPRPRAAPFPSKYPSQDTAREVEALGALATLPDVRPFLARGWRSWPSYSYVVPLNDLPGQWQRVERNLGRLVERAATLDIVFAEDDDFANPTSGCTN